MNKSSYQKDADDSPISSDYADEMEDGFVKLDGDTLRARWSGDQTKYTPPNRCQSAATVVKNTFESLTFANAQSTAATATKSLTSAASAYLGGAMKRIPNLLPPQWQNPSAALRFAPTASHEGARTQWLRTNEQEALADAYLAASKTRDRSGQKSAKRTIRSESLGSSSGLSRRRRGRGGIG
ncbi:MAG: hypothetical protein Q9167_007542 [Letrouitia subvulpina]